MTKIFSPDGTIYGIMNRLYQLLLLNLLIIVTSLPIITIGAAVTTAYSVCYKLQKHEEGTLYKLYFSQFKAELKKSTLIWLILLSCGGLFFLGYNEMRTVLLSQPVLYGAFMLILAILSLTLLYVFPLTARFENKLPATMLNSLMLALKHLPYSILIFLLMIGLLVVVPLYLPKLFFLWLTLAASTTIYLSSILFQRIFSQYEKI